MTIHIRFFAVIRERAGRSALELVLPARSTVANAMNEIRTKQPEVSDLLDRCAVAVNREYVSTSTLLNEGDELAIIPPVSGG